MVYFRVAVLILVGGFGAVGCGGNVEREPGEPSEAEPGDSGSKPGAGDLSSKGGTALGDCKLGALEYKDYDAPCAWVAEGRCYAEREMACNCSCPRSGTSLCISGFEGGPEGHVGVSCN